MDSGLSLRPPVKTFPMPPDAGAAYVFDVRSGELLQTIPHPEPEEGNLLFAKRSVVVTVA